MVPTPYDMYETHSWDNDALVQPESRAAYLELLEQGWMDCLKKMHPDEKIYTYWDYKRKRWPRNAGLRIDHLLISDPLKPLLTNAKVDKEVRGKEGASDHAPTFIELDWNP